MIIICTESIHRGISFQSINRTHDLAAFHCSSNQLNYRALWVFPYLVQSYIWAKNGFHWARVQMVLFTSSAYRLCVLIVHTPEFLICLNEP